MKRLLLPLLALGLLIGSAACHARVHARAGGSVSGPSMVSIAPGVWVVEDSPQPLFWDDGYYWRYHGGVWYRSSYYDRGFVRVRARVVPTRIRTIDRPRRYVRYRAPSRARVRRGPPRSRVRDHRRQRTYERRDVRQRRDHRHERRERVRDRRDDRRERVRDRREDRRERVRDRRDDRRERSRGRDRVRDHRDD